MVGDSSDIALFRVLSGFAFVFGACVASFLNVVIYRVPRGESLVSPPSHCPKCGAPIRWYQNIPIFAYLALRGKCANCKAPISPRYLLIETLGGLLYLAAFLRFGPTPFMLVMWIWIALMIVGSMIDFDLKLLPDFVTVGGMVLGVGLGVVDSCRLQSIAPAAWSVAGLVFGFGLLWLVRFFGSKAFRREAMGMGDVFLMGAVGAIFGPVGVLVTLILSSVFGSMVGIALVALAKAKFGKFVEIPYGPYICLACLAYAFYGVEIVEFYLRLFR